MVSNKIIPQYLTMTEMAARLIRERVLSGHYYSGDRLIPEKLEAELGLGRVAIREALRELTGSGLVVSLPNKGVIVAEPPDGDEIKAIYNARYALEGETAYQAAKNITPDVIARMEDLIKQMEATVKDPFNLILLNREFHLILYEASGWKPACRIIHQLFDQTLIFRGLHKSWVADDPALFHQDHRGIIEALKAGDAEAAKEKVVANIYRGFHQYVLNHTSSKKKNKKSGRNY
ncbi:MAG: GntR family transcriptional regulator [Deltaproteobacteria bacterium]|nr:GntR family transcriptional regulator [Deltaproteobacteria bacterium]